MSEQAFRANRPDVIDEQFDREYVIVNLRTGVYYSLNEPAARMWDALNAHGTRSAILDALAQQFDAEPATIALEFDRLTQEMQRAELIVPISADQSLQSQANTHPASKIPFRSPEIQEYNDMQALLLLDPIHQVDESGWPATKPNDG